MGNVVWRPFSQGEVGDALGLTNVYVSKTMTRLREEGTLAVEGNAVTLTDPDVIARRIGFVDRYADIDRERVRRGEMTDEATDGPMIEAAE